MNKKMKITGRGLIVGIVLITSPLMPARAADVNITVSGKVVTLPCTVSTTSQTVDLGTVYTFDMLSAGAASAWKSVALLLTNCPLGTTQVTATFSGTADSTGYYKNVGTAGNIQLQLQSTAGQNLNNGAAMQGAVNGSQSANFALQVRALTIAGNATQGTISSVINVTYTYS